MSHMERMNVAEWLLERGASANPEGTAIIADGTPIAYATLPLLVRTAAGALKEAECRSGSRLLICLPDCPELVAAFLGAIWIGALPVLISPHVTASEYAYYLRDCVPSVAIIHASNVERLSGVNDPGIRTIVVGDGDFNGGSTWSSAMKAAAEAAEAVPANPEDPAFLLYSSGSTGQPKGVIHNHRSIVAACRNFGEGVLQISRDDRTFSISKLFFAYGLGNALYYPISAGATTILESGRTTLESVAKVMSSYHPTLFFGVPSFYRLLLPEMENGFGFDWTQVRCAISAGESLPGELFEWMRSKTGVEILDGLGSTEMLQTFISNRPGSAKRGSCGITVPNYQVRLVNENGQDVKVGEIGALLVTGDSMFAGYWNDDELTHRVKKDGWISTGDKLCQASDGYYRYVGRDDDMLKISGMWASPVEAEHALKRLPHVADAFVCASSNASAQRQLVAYLVSTGDVPPPGPEQMRRELFKQIQEHMIPSAFVWVNELPRTPNGKIDRHRLPALDQSSVECFQAVAIAHENGTQEYLASMWSELLEIERPDPDIGFMALGGNSVTAMMCLNRILERYGIDLDFELLFLETGTMRAIAAEIDRARAHVEVTGANRR
jgi:benzoate-CoA ligase